MSGIETSSPHGVAEALSDVRQRIAAKSRAANRDPADVTLIAVSKTHTAPAIEAAIVAGQRHFGENRVQEAAAQSLLPPCQRPMSAPMRPARGPSISGP